MRCAQGFLWIASNARSGPIPLPPGGRVVWERGEAFSLWIRFFSEVSGFLVVGCAVVLAMGWDAVGGSAGSVLRSQVSSGEDRLLRCAQVFLWIASNARSGSIPRPPAGGVVWERGEAFSLWIRLFFERFLGFSWGSALWFWRWGGMPLGGALRDRSCARR